MATGSTLEPTSFQKRILTNITIEPAIFLISFAGNLDDVRCDTWFVLVSICLISIKLELESYNENCNQTRVRSTITILLNAVCMHSFGVGSLQLHSAGTWEGQRPLNATRLLVNKRLLGPKIQTREIWAGSKNPSTVQIHHFWGSISTRERFWSRILDWCVLHQLKEFFPTNVSPFSSGISNVI